MEQILIPIERAKILEQRLLNEVQKKLNCKIEVRNGNEIAIEGSGYDEYNARNVIQAFGRGFNMPSAYRLLEETYFFKYIDLRDMFRNKEQIKRIRSVFICSFHDNHVYFIFLIYIFISICHIHPISEGYGFSVVCIYNFISHLKDGSFPATYL